MGSDKRGSLSLGLCDVPSSERTGHALKHFLGSLVLVGGLFGLCMLLIWNFLQ